MGDSSAAHRRTVLFEKIDQPVNPCVLLRDAMGMSVPVALPGVAHHIDRLPADDGFEVALAQFAILNSDFHVTLLFAVPECTIASVRRPLTYPGRARCYLGNNRAN